MIVQQVLNYDQIINSCELSEALVLRHIRCGKPLRKAVFRSDRFPDNNKYTVFQLQRNLSLIIFDLI